MRRIKLVLAALAVMVVTLFVVAGPATAEDVDVVDVFVSGDEVCVVYEIEEDDDDADNDIDDEEDADDDDEEEDVVIECEDID